MYVIKHHNIIQSDMPSHIREMAKESYLYIFCLTQILTFGIGRQHRRQHMSDRLSSMGLKSQRAKNGTNCLPAWEAMR